MNHIKLALAALLFAASAGFLGAQQAAVEWVKDPEYFRFVRNAVRSAPGGFLTGVGTAGITGGDIARARFIAHTRAVLDIYRRIKPFAAAFLPELSEIDFRREIVCIVDSNYLIDGAFNDGKNWITSFIDSIFAYSSIIEEGSSGGNYRVVAALAVVEPRPSPNPPGQPRPDSVSGTGRGDPVLEFVRNARRAASEKAVMGVGTASLTTPDMSRTAALFRACMDIAQQLDVRPRSSITGGIGRGDSAAASRYLNIFSITQTVFEKVALNAAVFAEAYINGEYIVIVTMIP